MAWFRKKDREPRQSRDRREIPADAWTKCDECGHVDLRERFERSLQVCPECGCHGRVDSRVYVDILTDDGSFQEFDQGLRSVNCLQFEGYTDRLARAHRNAATNEAILTGAGTLDGETVGLGVMEFSFMGGSMGAVVGEKIARVAQYCVDKHAPLLLVSRSGGARMQEGVLSLMQMAKTSVWIARLSEEGTPFISIMTDPTSGGVTASFAMQGDIHIAEPGAFIGFAGPRVIKQTIGQDLPGGFQRAEFLAEHGMVDLILPRHELRETVSRLLRMMLGR